MVCLMQLPSRSCTGCVYPEGVPAGRLRVLDLNSDFQERRKRDTHLDDALRPPPVISPLICWAKWRIPGRVTAVTTSLHFPLSLSTSASKHLACIPHTCPHTPVPTHLSTHQDIYVIKHLSSALISLLSLAWPAQPTWHFSQGSGLL